MNLLDIETICILGFLTSLIISLLITATKKLYNVSNLIKNNPQKIHEGYIPRLGGIAIICGLVIQNYLSYNYLNNTNWVVLIAAAPVFVFGLTEDLLERVHPYWRLFGAFLSGLIFVILTKVTITDVGFAFLNIVLENKIFAIVFTIMAVILMTNSLNLIDGLNGLAMGSTIIMLSCLSVIQFHLTENLNDILIYLGLISVILGVLVFNYPIAKLFLGDGGAYLLGCMVSFYVIFIAENYVQVSPFASLLIVWYPIYETLRTFLRRVFIEKISPIEPDTWHLHSIYFKYELEIKKLGPYKANYVASIKILFLPLLSSIYTFFYYDSRNHLIIGLCISILVYEMMYYFKKNKIKN